MQVRDTNGRWAKGGAVVASLLLLGVLASRASAFPAEDDQTPGSMALNFNKQNNAWSRFDFGVVDGKVTTSPPDSVKYDRRVEALGIVGAEACFSKRFGARFNAKAEYSLQRQQEKEVPRATVDTTVKTYRPAVDLTFITDKGLEIFAGEEIQLIPTYKENVTSANGESSTTFKKSSLPAKRLGVVRRAGSWSGGFYYVMGAQKDRTVEQKAFDGSGSSTNDVVFVPSRLGVMGDFKAASAFWDFELDFIQARGKGPKDENDNTTYTDFFEAKLGSTYFFGPSLGMGSSVFHKTLSYASNAFVTIETIPVTSVKLVGLLGNDENHAFLGVIGAYGKDGQSLPEFNASYEMNAFAVTFGSLFSF